MLALQAVPIVQESDTWAGPPPVSRLHPAANTISSGLPRTSTVSLGFRHDFLVAVLLVVTLRVSFEFLFTFRA